MKRLLAVLASMAMVTLAAVTPAAAQTGLAVNPTAWASVTSQDPDQAHWSEYEPTWEGADVSVGRTDQGEVTRAFFELDVTAFAGKRVLDANFVLYVRAHGACGPDTEMWETGRISSQTTWNDQPQWLRELSTSPADCGVQGWMISEAVKDAVARGDEVVTIGLKSADESTAGRYVFWTTPSVGNATGPGMSVRYNTVPDVPSGQAVTAGDCQAPPGGPYLRTTTPSFLAMLTDPDHGGNEIMRGRFEWADAAGAKIGEAVTTEQTGDARHCVTVPAGQLADGGSYTWRVRAENSYTVVGPGGYETYWDMGEWSAWQPELHIDQAPPANPPAISSADFPENQVGGRVGQPGTFTLAPNGVTDVASYDYDFGRGFVPVRAGADGTATVTFIPTNTFPQRLIARSVDRAGNLGPTVTYAFRAAPR